MHTRMRPLFLHVLREGVVGAFRQTNVPGLSKQPVLQGDAPRPAGVVLHPSRGGAVGGTLHPPVEDPRGFRAPVRLPDLAIPRDPSSLAAPETTQSLFDYSPPPV